MEREGALTKSCYEAGVTLTPKLDKDTTATKKNYRPNFIMSLVAKIFNKILANCIQ
jgi:hypothetical protein